MRARAVALLFVLVLVLPTAAVAVRPPLPPTPPPPHVPNVLATPPSVRIDRDPYGVPHVYANDTYALFWGNGYAQARDRLFQMDVLRHVGRGRGAEVLGPSQLPLDVATRRDLYTESERTDAFHALTPQQQLIFRAFADGVNGWILETRKDPTKLSAEFYAIAHPPEDWIPEDTIAIAQFLLAIFGAGNGGGEFDNAAVLVHLLQNANLSQAEAQKAFDDLFFSHDATAYSTIPAAEGTWAGAQDAPLTFAQIPALQWAAVFAAVNATPFGAVNCFAGGAIDPNACKKLGSTDLPAAARSVGLPIKWGSNALVVDGNHSQSGKPLLLGGPQMSYFNPMVPYEVGLHGAGFDALGMGIGGAPGVIIGRTSHYSWTVTSGEADQEDVVAERLVPGSSRSYFVDGVPTPMTCRNELHFGLPTAIDTNPPILATQEVCRTVDGPVFAINETAGYAFVRQGAHRNKELESGIQWLTLSQEPDLASFRAHMENFCFTFNFLQASDDGHIAYNHWGCNPIHETTTPYDVRLPRPSDAQFRWTGIRHGSDLPHIVDPAQGYLVNWNNLPEQGFSAGAAREQWGTSHRVQLFDRTVQKYLAASGGKLNATNLEQINKEISTSEPFAYWFVPKILDAVSGSTDPETVSAAHALAAWRDCGYCWDDDHNGNDVTPGGSVGARYVYPGFAIYEQWRGLFEDRMRDELGDQTRAMNFDPPTDSDPHAADHGKTDNKDQPLLKSVLGTSNHNWCDDVTTPAIETCTSAIKDTLATAIEALTVQYGTTDVSMWLQPIHMIKFSALSGGPSWLIPMVNRPSFNHYYDWGTGTAKSVLPPGTDQYWFPAGFARFKVDGTLPDAHKHDQLEFYRHFQYKPANMVPIVISTEKHDAAPPPVTFGCQSGSGCTVAAPVTDG